MSAKTAVLGFIGRWMGNRDREYPQTWALWSKWGRRLGLYRLGLRFCGWWGGHEWSRTEWGYGGCGIDRWCRWCNQFTTVPVSENTRTDEQCGLMGLVGQTITKDTPDAE